MIKSPPKGSFQVRVPLSIKNWADEVASKNVGSNRSTSAFLSVAVRAEIVTLQGELPDSVKQEIASFRREIEPTSPRVTIFMSPIEYLELMEVAHEIGTTRSKLVQWAIEKWKKANVFS